jgi:hypothetical protein
MIRVLLICLFIPLSIVAQEKLPLNLNQAYISNSQSLNSITVIRTYRKRDYRSEQIHHFTEKGLNTLTTSYFNGEQQDIVNLRFDTLNRLIGFKHFGTWHDSANGPSWDSTLVTWQNEYLYDSNGQIEKCINQWFNSEQKPTSRIEMSFQYDSLNRIIEETETFLDLTTSEYKILFEPNSVTISPNQVPDSNVNNKRKYSYKSDTLIINNYRDEELTTKQIVTKSEDLKTEIVKNSSGEILRSTISRYNKNGLILTEITTGDLNISLFGEYGDGMRYDNVAYKYNHKGLLKRIKYTNTKSGTIMYMKYKYKK